jgi:hypothetical protein
MHWDARGSFSVCRGVMAGVEGFCVAVTSAGGQEWAVGCDGAMGVCRWILRGCKRCWWAELGALGVDGLCMLYEVLVGDSGNGGV